MARLVSWRIAGIASVLAFLLTAPTAGAQEKPFAGATVIPIRDGANAVDLDGDGINDLVVKGMTRDEHGNPVWTYTFYLTRERREPYAPARLIVPFVESHRGMIKIKRESIEIDVDKDCNLSEMLLIQESGDGRAPSSVILAERAYVSGIPAHEPDRVMFLVHKLAHRSGHERFKDEPAHYYHHQRDVWSEQPYCDAGQAFFDTLGLGPSP